jgi:hypothetical protein
MASIQKEVPLPVSAEQVWDALRDVGALHTRLVPGFVSHTELEPDGRARLVTFANGMVAREVIVTVDAVARRLVWSTVGGKMSHHNASAQVFEEGSGCRFVWIADLLPDELAPAIASMIEQGLSAISRKFASAS